MKGENIGMVDPLILFLSQVSTDHVSLIVSLLHVIVPQVKEIEIAVDEKELQKEVALKEKEKELQALRMQLGSLSHNLHERTSEASRSGQEQASKVSNLLAELQKMSIDKKGKRNNICRNDLV